jgi:hypothetical protein
MESKLKFDDNSEHINQNDDENEMDQDDEKDSQNQNTLWKLLKMDTLNSNITRKEYLSNLIKTMENKLSFDNKYKWIDYILLIYQALILIIILFLFIVYYLKCYRYVLFQNHEEQLNNTDLLSNFSKKLDNKSIILRIPFCSSLFKDGNYKKQDTLLGLIFLNFKIFYFVTEALGFVMFLTEKFRFSQRIKRKILDSICDKFECNSQIVFLILISFIITILTWLVILILCFYMYILFECICLLVLNTPKDFFEFLKPTKIFKRFINFSHSVLFTNYNNNLLIQLLMLYSIFKLLDRLKVCGMFGLLIIQHGAVLTKFLNLSIFGSLLKYVMTKFFKNLNESNLLSYLYIKDSQNGTTNLKKLTISNLSDGIKELFNDELNDYIYVNSKINEIFLIFLIILIIFFIFITFHMCYEKFDIYKSELELARIEQLLIKYHRAKRWKSRQLAISENENVTPAVLNKKRNYLNYIWKPFYFFYNFVLGRRELDEFLINEIKNKCNIIELRNNKILLNENYFFKTFKSNRVESQAENSINLIEKDDSESLDVYLQILKDKFPNIYGLENPNFYQDTEFYTNLNKTRKFIRLLNLDNNYWICIASGLLKRYVHIFSISSEQTLEGMNVIKNFVNNTLPDPIDEENIVIIKYSSNNNQNNQLSFYYSIAFATFLCFNFNLESIKSIQFNENELVQHYKQCVNSKLVSKFALKIDK